MQKRSFCGMASKPKRLKTWNAQALGKLNNNDLIQVFAQAIADRSILKEGNLTIENRIKHGAPFGSIELLLQEVERRKIAIADVANRVAADAKEGRSFISTLVAPPSWKLYEIKAAHVITKLLESEGIRPDRVEFDARVKGCITGEERQVDLLIVQNQPLHVVACEFRDYPNRSLTVDQVEALANKLKDIGANKGVLVTRSGYQRGAIATAKHHSIVLFRLKEVPSAEVRRSYPDRVNDIQDNRVYWVLKKDDQAWVLTDVS